MKQLSILKRIILAAVAILVTRGAVIVRVIALPVIISITLKTAALHAGLAYFVYASWIIDWLLFVFVAVSLHRVCLRGEHSLPKFGTLTAPGLNDGMYALVALVALLLGAGLCVYSYGGWFVFVLMGIERGQSDDVLKSLIYFFFSWSWLVLTIVLIARFSLWLPAVALGHRYSIREVWRLGRSQNILLIVSVIALPLVLYFLLSFPANAVIAITPLNMLINTIPYLLGILLLSVTYAEISRDESVWRTEEVHSKG